MLTGSKFFLRDDFTSVFSFALPDSGIADGNFILEETKESKPPSDADPGETEILHLQSQQETGIVCFFLYAENSRGETDDHLKKFFHYHFVEPNRPRENAATNAQNSSVQTEAQSSKSGIIERSFCKFLSEPVMPFCRRT